jgi:hypothetical protein
MLIGELMNELESRSMKEVCEDLGVSPTTVQRKLKKLGYEWDNSEKVWLWKHEEAAPDDTNLMDIINKPGEGKPVNKAANNPDNNKTIKQDPHDNPNPNNNPVDVFDKLINPERKINAKVQRGFYFDPDVIKALDRNVKSKYKSEFVNEALKRVLKEKGLLK